MDAEVSESCINFEWCLSGEVTKQAGTVNFAIRFETINTETEEIEYRWTTTPCSLTVLAGIAWSDENVAATYPTVLEQWLQEMTDLKAEINDMALNVGGQIAGTAEATEKANTAATNATEATGQANTATTNANDAADAANAAAAAANTAAANANQVSENANASILATKDAAIADINTAKDATIAATQEAAEATTKANTAADNATDAAAAANAAAEDLEQIKADALTATTKANNAGEYPLTYGAEIVGLQIGDSFKKNQIWRVKETYANNLGIRAGLYICRFNYVHTDKSKTFIDLLSDYTFVFMLDEGKGDQGEKGEKGDTPVVGVDYYTAEQQAALAEEIANLVLTDVNMQLDDINGENGDPAPTALTVDTTAADYTGTAWIVSKAYNDILEEDSITFVGSKGSMTYSKGGTITLGEIIVVDGADVSMKGATISKVDFESGTITLELDEMTYNVIAEKQDLTA